MNMNEVFNEDSTKFKSNDTLLQFHISNNWSYTINKFQCNSGKILSSELVNDLVADCGIEADDESILKSMLLNGSYFECEHPSELPCKEGHPRCYNLTDICTFKLNSANQLRPCRNGGHLENCGQFECNVMFKCLNAYCIPWVYVCNSKWDCPEGDDETHDSLCEIKKVCFFMFKCKSTSNICVHTSNLCDRNNDCPHGDDESLCDLKDFKCPNSCKCLLYSINCNNALLRTIKKYGSFSFLPVYIFNSTLISVNLLMDLMMDAFIVKLPKNGIIEICNNCKLKEVVLLDVSFNLLKIIKRICFISMLKLISLSLNNNEIRLLEENSFFNVTHLKFLNLSNNLLFAVSIIFSTNSSYNMRLNVFYVTNFTQKNIDGTFISTALAKVILIKNYQLWCVSPPETICTAQSTWYISCSELLPNYRLKIMFIIVSCVLIALSILSICLHIKSMSHNFYSVIVCSLNLHGAICGLYTVSISVANKYYSENFYYKQDNWRSSTICFALSGLVIWYRISLQLQNLFLSLSRFMVVIHPMNTIFKQVKFTVKTLFFIYTFSFALSTLFILLHKIVHDTQAISLCFPFVDPTKKVLLIKLIAWFVALTEVISSVIIIILHVQLVIRVRKSEKNARSSKSIVSSDSFLLVQLILLTISTMLCWYPANVLYIAAIFLSTYSMDLIIWTIVLIFPINSILNPSILLYLLLERVDNPYSEYFRCKFKIYRFMGGMYT